MMPRTTSNCSSPISSGRRGEAGNRTGDFTDTMIASRQRVNQAVDADGPEFSGLPLDDIERDRGWPVRSAKTVLQLGLAPLARHYGNMAQTKGRSDAPIRTWLAEGVAFAVGRG